MKCPVCKKPMVLGMIDGDQDHETIEYECDKDCGTQVVIQKTVYRKIKGDGK